jgi:exopolysaccharide biosynthesis polyprenyl glycosylphosphotransferase
MSGTKLNPRPSLVDRAAPARGFAGRRLPFLLALDAIVTLGILLALSVPLGHALALTVMTLVVLASIGAYGLSAARPDRRVPSPMLLVLAAGPLLFAASVTTTSDISSSRLSLVLLLGFPIAWTATRWAAHALVGRSRERTLIVGSSKVALHVLTLMSRHATDGIAVVGFVDDDPCEVPVGAPPVLGSLHELPGLCSAYEIDRVIVTFTTAPDAVLLQALRECAWLDTRIQVVPRMFDMLGPQSSGLGNLGLVEVTRRRPVGVELAVKRSIDVVLSALAFALLLPAMALIAIWIKLNDGGPILFSQERIGRGGRSFRIHKFRTMSHGPHRSEPSVHSDVLDGAAAIDSIVRSIKAAGELHVTTAGRFLRRTSLDELPQLWNVLRGEMSLVGPRPLRAFEVASLAPWQTPRQEVLPGLTGLWQIQGRSDVDWHERLQLDYSYAHSWSLATDLRILVETIPAVLKGRGAR